MLSLELSREAGPIHNIMIFHECTDVIINLRSDDVLDVIHCD